MTDNSSKQHNKDANSPQAKTKKEERLAENLRQNLRRRKQVVKKTENVDVRLKMPNKPDAMKD